MSVSIEPQRGHPMDTCDTTTSPVPSCSLDSLEHQITELAARYKMRVARSLESLPRIGEAFRSGQVSYSKVRAPLRGQV